MRRGLRLLLMALVCALLGGVYVLLGSAVAPAEAPAPESTDAPGYFMLYEDSVAALKSITVQPKGAQRYTAVSDMAFDQNGNLLGVYNALSQPFLVSGQEDFTFSTAAWQMLLLTAQHIPATATYPALDRDACGLTDPDAQGRHDPRPAHRALDLRRRKLLCRPRRRHKRVPRPLRLP